MSTAEPAVVLSARGTAAKVSWRFVLLLVAPAAALVVAPFFFFGNASGHDIQFHLSSWMDVAGQWHQGILYPRWAEWANWGFGEPRFVFYPPLSWTLGAALGLLLPWSATPGAYAWLTLVLGGMAMWRLAREWLPEPQAAAAAVFFAVNPYNLAMIYYRSDFAELLGVALFPLLIWAAAHVLGGEWRRMPHLAAIFAAIWLANAPEGVIATYSLVLLLAVTALRQRAAGPLLRGAVGMAAGFGLAAFFILPAARERSWVQIAQVVGANLQPARNFLFTHSSDAEFQLFNWKISSVAVGMMLVTGAAAAFAVLRRRTIGKIWWTLLGLGIACAFLMLPLSGALWRHLPELAFLQFPWRWLGPLAVTFAFLTAVAIAGLERTRDRRIATALLLAAIGTSGALIGASTWWNSEDAPLIAGEIRDGHGYEGVDEYQPLGDDRYDLQNATPDAEQLPDVPATPPIEIFDSASEKPVAMPATMQVRMEQWTSERERFSVSTPEPVTLALRLLSYPAWQAQVDGAAAQTNAAPETAQMLLPLPAGNHHVEIRFTRTADRTAGGAISIFSAIALLGFAWNQRRPTGAARKAAGA